MFLVRGRRGHDMQIEANSYPPENADNMVHSGLGAYIRAIPSICDRNRYHRRVYAYQAGLIKQLAGVRVWLLGWWR